MGNNDELLEEGYTKIQFSRRGKIGRFRWELKRGRKYGYPICCVIRYALEMAWQDGKTFDLATFRQREPRLNGKDSVFIPCHIFHSSSSPEDLEENLESYRD